jgi:hypothetical protein
MDGNHQDRIGNKQTVFEDVSWTLCKKSKLWLPQHKKQASATVLSQKNKIASIEHWQRRSS